MRLLHTTAIILLLSCFHIHIATAKVKVPSDVKVADEPGEDDCDYSFYLWQVLNNEVSDIDYYKILGIERFAADKDIRRGFKKESKIWEEWAGTCGIRNFDKARGDVILSDAYSILSNSDARRRHDSNFKHPQTTFEKIRSNFSANIGKYWQSILGGVFGLVIIQLLNSKVRARIWSGLGLQKRNPVINELRLQRIRRLQKQHEKQQNASK